MSNEKTMSKDQNEKVAKKPVIERAADRIPEKDGAPKGYTYRLLKKDIPEFGVRGRIVTLTFAQAKALKEGDAVIPSKAQITRGVL